MSEASPSPASITALRDALLKGCEPAPAPILAQLAAYRWIVVATACIGSFMGQVDASIAQLLLPTLEHDFGARLSTVSWVPVAYLLAMAAFLPIFGRLADMVGRKLLYTMGFVLFVVGSAFCGLAPNLPTLIAFRVLQGIGAALLGANAVAIIVVAAGAERRGRALGIQSAAQAVGLGLGPTIGGLLMDTLGWQWVFWINVPFGLVGAVLAWFVIPQTEALPSSRDFDWIGAFLIVPALTALVTVVNEANAWGVTSPIFLSSAVLALIAWPLFIRAERRAQTPLIELSLFRQSGFAGGNVAALLSYAALFGIFFLMPFMFIRVYQDSALAAGLRLSIVAVLLGAIAPFGGALSDWLGSRIVTVAGMLITVAALVLLFTVLDGQPGSLPMIMLALAIFGSGQGLFISPNNSAVMAAAPARLTGAAGSLLTVMRCMGTSVGVAASAALLAWRLQALTGLDGTIHAPAEALLSAGRDVIVLVGCCAAVAAAISLLQPSRPQSPRAEAGRIPAGPRHARDQAIGPVVM